MADDKKPVPAAALKLGPIDKDDDKDTDHDDLANPDKAKTMAAEDVMGAVKSGDVKAFESALDDYLKLR